MGPNTLSTPNRRSVARPLALSVRAGRPVQITSVCLKDRQPAIAVFGYIPNDAVSLGYDRRITGPVLFPDGLRNVPRVDVPLTNRHATVLTHAQGPES
jgi:hypothetical protein